MHGEGGGEGTMLGEGGGDYARGRGEGKGLCTGRLSMKFIIIIFILYCVA